MRIGRLRHRITIEEPTRTADGMGGWTVTWTEVSTVWAGVEPVSGKERIAADAVEAEVTHKVIIRYASWLTPDMRITFGDRHFDIRAIINPAEKDVMQEILATEIVGS
jgi:SPP1 family predicted phage head-tail adaptor